MNWQQYYPLLFFLIVLPILWYIYRRNSEGGSFLGNGSILAKYSRDLTLLAREKKLDPVIGRDHEISQVVQILSRRNKNNPVLVGSAGVGKTAIAEGLALRVANKLVPTSLYNKKVLALDLTGILAGTKYRGEFEQRLKKITDEIVSSKRTIILFIDEIHILAEAGEAEGAINAADILKPLLARGDLQVVGATTKEEYMKFIKQDKTLDRRLQPVLVPEASEAETEEILNGIKSLYEDYHKVKITAAAIKEAIRATKILKNRAYPDKAIDAIDESCSQVHISSLGDKNKKAEVGPENVRQVVSEWAKMS
ncbi:MAG: AAA family ATPase [Patescibacteria group bacterium]